MAGELQVDNITNSAGTGPVGFPDGITTASFVAPTVQKFTSSSGTYTLPTSPRSPLYIRVVMAGGGGGGSGSGQTNSSGSSGGISTFGISLLTCNGGLTSGEGIGGTGGTASLGSGPIGIAIQGGYGGGAGGNNAITTVDLIGGSGGVNTLGGAGGPSLTAGVAGISNTGAGGGGAGTIDIANAFGGPGGGAGGYLEAYISNPNATYSYVVGAGGAGGGAGTSGSSGGAGGSGVIFITEYYQ